MKTKRIALVLTLVLVLSMATTAFAANNPFSDLPADHWAYDSIVQLAAVGLIEGYPDGTFGGSRMLTRYEAAMVFARALERLENIIEAGLAEAGDDSFEELALNERLRKAERRLATLSNAEGDFATLYGQVSALNDKVGEMNSTVTKLDGTVGLLNPVVINLNSEVKGLSSDVQTLYGLAGDIEADVAELEKELDAKIIDLANITEAEMTNLKALVVNYQGEAAELENKFKAELVNVADIVFKLNNEFARELALLEKRVGALEEQTAALDKRVDSVGKVQFNGVVKSNYSNLQVFEGEGDNETKIAGPVKGILGYKDDTYETKLGNFSSEMQLTIATKVSDNLKVNLFGSVKGDRPNEWTELDKYTVEVLSDSPISRLVLGTVSDKDVKNRFGTTILNIQPANGVLADAKVGPVDVNFVSGVKDKDSDGLVAAIANYELMPELGLKLAASQLLDKNLEATDSAKVGILVGAYGNVAGVNYAANFALDRYNKDVDKNTFVDVKVDTEIGVLGLDVEYALAGENFATGTGELASKGFVEAKAKSRLKLGAKADIFGLNVGVENYQEQGKDKSIDGIKLEADTKVDLGIPVAVSGRFVMMNEPADLKDAGNSITAKVGLDKIDVADVKLGVNYTFAKNYIDGDWYNPSKWLKKDVHIIAANAGYDLNWGGADVALGYDFGYTIPFGDTATDYGNQMSHAVKAEYKFAKDLKFNVNGKQVTWEQDTPYKVNEIKAGFEYKF